LPPAEWFSWLTANTGLDANNRAKQPTLFARRKDDNAAYVMRQLSLPARSAGSRMAVDQVRLFRNDPAVRWEYRVHEQILLSIRRQNSEVRWTDLVIAHAGYQDLAESHRKLERNVRLMH